MEYTHEEYCNVHVKSHYIILVDVVQTLMCSGDRSSVSVGHEFFSLLFTIPPSLWRLTRYFILT